MQSVLLLILLAGCAANDGSACTQDSDCGGDVCARDGACTPASGVREVTVLWQIDGMSADETRCSAIPELFVQFDGLDFRDTLGFAPVPCAQGKFHVDKLPTRYLEVELGVDDHGAYDIAPIDAQTNIATFDLSLSR
jgi:hypothetical protein